MRLLGCCLSVWLVLKLTLIIVIVSAPISSLILHATLVVVLLMLAGVEFLKDLKPPLFLDVVIVHEFRVV
jgi:hypothetical protein